MRELKYSYLEFLDNLTISSTLKAILYEEYLKREAYWKSQNRDNFVFEKKYSVLGEKTK